ncbi:MAG: VTT domain-containing protein, partial [Pseudomonadota bacterium]
FLIPGFVFVLTASAIWPFGEAVIYSWLGALGACVVGYGMAHYMAKEYADRFMPGFYQEFTRRLAQSGFGVVVFTRLFLGLTWVATFGLALSGIKFRTNILASAVTLIWPISLITFFGDIFFQWAGQQNTTTWIVLAGLVSGIMFMWFYGRYKRRRAWQAYQAQQPVIIDVTPGREEPDRDRLGRTG